MEHGLIYCVDDDPDILLLYQTLLVESGHEVVLLESGANSLDLIARRQPDLIILDEKMSDLSGLEICLRLRRDETLPFIPIIMVTGIDSRDIKLRSLEQGIDDYILKPFDHEELLAKVQVMLRIKRLYAELLQTRQDLLKAEKLAAIGQLAAAMAHEIRNPLSIISASVQFLQGRCEPTDEGREIMETVLRKISEIDSTIRELLVVARPLKLKREPLDLNACVREMAGFIREKCLVQRVTLRPDLAEALPPVLADREHLERVLLNLFINALDSMPVGGELRVTTRRAPEARLACVIVEDTGEGILPEDLPHVFEPFFTRRPGGSGLGLYVVKTVVDELGGTLEALSRRGEGSRFTLCLRTDPAEPSE